MKPVHALMHEYFHDLPAHTEAVAKLPNLFDFSKNQFRGYEKERIARIGDVHEVGKQLSFLSKWLYDTAGMSDSYQVVSHCGKCERSLKKTIRPDMYGLHLITYAYEVGKRVGLDDIMEKEVREAVWDAGAARCACGSRYSRSWPVLPNTLYINIDCRN